MWSGQSTWECFTPYMRKAGSRPTGKDAVVVWWGALRGAIGLALALVVYSEHLRYEFTVEDAGSGYKEATTAVFVVESDLANQLVTKQNPNLYQGASLSHAEVSIQGGKVQSISQSTALADRHLATKTTKQAAEMREKLASGEMSVVIMGEGGGAIARLLWSAFLHGCVISFFF